MTGRDGLVGQHLSRQVIAYVRIVSTPGGERLGVGAARGREGCLQVWAEVPQHVEQRREACIVGPWRRPEAPVHERTRSFGRHRRRRRRRLRTLGPEARLAENAAQQRSQLERGHVGTIGLDQLTVAAREHPFAPVAAQLGHQGVLRQQDPRCGPLVSGEQGTVEGVVTAEVEEAQRPVPGDDRAGSAESRVSETSRRDRRGS